MTLYLWLVAYAPRWLLQLLPWRWRRRQLQLFVSDRWRADHFYRSGRAE